MDLMEIVNQTLYCEKFKVNNMIQEMGLYFQLINQTKFSNKGMRRLKTPILIILKILQWDKNNEIHKLSQLLVKITKEKL